MVQKFWDTCSKDYLKALQERSKRLQPQDNAAVGDVVLLKNIQYPPCLWPMGIITKVFPGEDG